jgi:pyruvate/2-oxoglutarate dehydrogenase complex dihydrolipoamide acyltransferase (E2) component
MLRSLTSTFRNAMVSNHARFYTTIVMKVPRLPDSPHVALFHGHEFPVGARVRTGQTVLILDNLKTTLELPSPVDGTIVGYFAQPNQVLRENDPLLAIEDHHPLRTSTEPSESCSKLAPSSTSQPVQDPSPKPHVFSAEEIREMQIHPAPDPYLFY